MGTPSTVVEQVEARGGRGGAGAGPNPDLLLTAAFGKSLLSSFPLQPAATRHEVKETREGHFVRMQEKTTAALTAESLWATAHVSDVIEPC